MEKAIWTLAELEEKAAHFIDSLTPKENATLATLSGELGAGKTAFVKAVAKALGVEEVINSPTFVLEKIYLLPEEKNFKRLIHIDAYRLEKGEELKPLGFDELMKDSGNLILLEWPEKVSDALPTPNVRISLIANSDGSRIISYTYEQRL
ncbi:tRNA (adenosine(37)-N6)-threonylcarbamoyltransferase complex ATPase subunit type 1 TsaE [Candidatus Kaiserbacteria bacterium]|nr:tRNA (adenosine(37)-N6)-threonylcarbamoyltransferase complex ATPase subunit type 1 TsaE [Candidatus Kaiserbacteria bacterium]